MSAGGHIVVLYNKNTKETKKNAKPTKTSTNQTSKRSTRPNNPTIPKNTSNARLPGYNQNKKKFWRILWAKHHLSAVGFFGEEGAGK
jgi:hypothetical protein